MAARGRGNKPPFYVLECVVEGCDAEFYLNDIPAVRRGTELGAFYAGQSNQFVIDGTNELSIVVHPGDTPADALLGRAGRRTRERVSNAKAMARLVLYPFGAAVGGPDGEILLHCDWQSPEEESAYVFPIARAATGEVNTGAGSWAWEDAERLELDEAMREELRSFVGELHESLAAGNPDLLIEHSRPRLSDLARAYGLSPGQKEGQIRSVTESDAAQPWWGMQPLDPASFSFRLCANDRLVEIIGADWDPVLKECPDENDGVGQYAMRLGKLDGEWAILL